MTTAAEAKKLQSCGDVLDALFERHDTKDLATISRLTGVSRSTLVYWQQHPSSPVHKRGRDHVVRIFGPDSLPYRELVAPTPVETAYSRLEEIVRSHIDRAMEEARTRNLTIHTDLVLMRRELEELKVALSGIVGMKDELRALQIEMKKHHPNATT